MAAKIHSNDEVVVLTGKDKGKRGRVRQILSEDSAIVENVNLVKRHQKGNPSAGAPSGIVTKEAPIQLCNLAIFNAETGRADRVGFRMENQKKVRFFKSNGVTIK